MKEVSFENKRVETRIQDKGVGIGFRIQKV